MIYQQKIRRVMKLEKHTVSNSLLILTIFVDVFKFIDWAEREESVASLGPCSKWPEYRKTRQTH